MSTRERRVERGAWLIRRDLQEFGTDVRGARLNAGLPLREVARRVGTSASVILGTERGDLPGRRPEQLARHAAAVGMRARIKAYPDGSPIRDAAQVALIRAFRTRLGVPLPFIPEAPVTANPYDQRAFDGLLVLPTCRCALEFITRLHDCQAQLRGAQLKQRDGGVDRLIMVIRATHANRRAVASAADILAEAFPLGTRAVMAALVARRDPGANGIVFL